MAGKKLKGKIEKNGRKMEIVPYIGEGGS